MRVTVLSLALTLLGCEGGRGGFRYVSDMTDEELTDLCNDAREVFPPRDITCGGTTTTAGIAPDRCALPDEFLVRAGCTATASEVLDCMETLGDMTEAQFCALIAGTISPMCPDHVIACFGD